MNKQPKIVSKLINKDDRDVSLGKQYVSIPDLITFLNKYILKYTDLGKLSDAVNYFDMDNDG